ncbi:hypothetical protein [Methylibium rhizosphaerae]|uniref:hypothetical protein n=1 Tax=Methylibium rhizosphaerae TaxID=2570323 RepID=UPI001129D135|nr:hypothetical protein [Methylibium rhizosphaerae]
MDTYSLTSAEQLFAAFPEWRSLARSEQAEDGSSYLIVEVPPPAEANVQHGLVIDTSNDEVTVGFDCYHSHFDEWVGDGEHFGTLAALDFIKQIVSERVSVVSWWFNEEWRGSAQLEAGVPPQPPSWDHAGSFNRIRVRSWKGSFNADISA